MNNKQQLIKRIQHIELQIKKMALHTENSEVCSELYNSLILEKAILKKDLQNLSKNVFIESFKRILPKKEKLICDYFN